MGVQLTYGSKPLATAASFEDVGDCLKENGPKVMSCRLSARLINIGPHAHQRTGSCLVDFSSPMEWVYILL